MKLIESDQHHYIRKMQKQKRLVQSDFRGTNSDPMENENNQIK